MPSKHNRFVDNVSSSSNAFKRTGGPLVVIPRRRKHKNYISKKRNNQFFTDLKHSSDPNLYKSYHEWDKLIKVDISSINNIEKIKIKNESGDDYNVKGEDLSTSQNLLKNSSKILTNQPLSEDCFNKTIISSNFSSSIYKDKNVSCSKFVKNTTQNSNNFFNNEKSSNILSDCQSNLKKTIKPLINSSCVPSTSKAFLSTELHQLFLNGEKDILKNNNQKIKLNFNTYELAQIKKELLESRAKIGENLSKKIFNIKEKQQSKEEIDDAKAKNTVNAVTAAFSSKIKKKEVENKNFDIVTKHSLSSLGVAKKPPASPSTMARRFTIKTLESNLQLNDPKMYSNKLKNVPPTSIILPTLYKESKNEFKKSQKILDKYSINKIKDTDLSSSHQVDLNTNTPSTILSVLNSSHQKTQSNDQTQRNHQKKILPSKNVLNKSSLLNSLKLPPSVSAKVDKIIAGSDKKVLTVRYAYYFYIKINNIYLF